MGRSHLCMDSTRGSGILSFDSRMLQGRMGDDVEAGGLMWNPGVLQKRTVGASKQGVGGYCRKCAWKYVASLRVDNEDLGDSVKWNEWKTRVASEELEVVKGLGGRFCTIRCGMMT